MGLSYLRRDARPAAKRRGSKVGSGAASQTGRLRPLALEAMEGRLMLTHAAPVLDSAGTPAFTAIVENMPLAANIGSTVSDMLASGGAGFLTLDAPTAPRTESPSAFAELDRFNLRPEVLISQVIGRRPTGPTLYVVQVLEALRTIRMIPMRISNCAARLNSAGNRGEVLPKLLPKRRFARFCAGGRS